MKILKLRTSIQFGLWLKSLTTVEFCNLSGCPLPNVRTGVNAFLQVDAIKLRLREDYDKILLQKLDPVTLKALLKEGTTILTNKQGSISLDELGVCYTVEDLARVTDSKLKIKPFHLR